MSSTVFEPDVQDIAFVLFDQLDIDTSLKPFPQYADFDEDLYRSMVDEAARIATEVLHPINGPGDRQGVRLDGEGNVTTPDGYKAAWRVLAEGGWVAPGADPEFGGPGLPGVLGMVVSEVFTSACMAFQMYPGLAAAAGRIVQHFAPDPLKHWAERMFTGDWGGTMCLTEADAGTSVGDNRCKALPTEEEGVYLLEGEKVFISGGDHDLTDNIIHLVLAKTPGAPEGTKGLSLFMVPKFVVNDDGTNGERNGAFVVGIEEKMGIHGSSTCTLALGADRPCKAWLIGEEFRGIEIMFHMMNEARIGVGVQGMAIATAAYGYARAYANERIQGQSLRNMRDAEAPRVPIVQHPDVRRMLMSMKVHAETMRSFGYRMALRAVLGELTEDPAEKDRLNNIVDLMVPVLKAHCTDVGFEVAVTGVQVFGGYGYIAEYPAEQLVRDGKIMSIYEGTNGVQAMDLLGRKLRMKGGALLMQWMQEAREELKVGADAGFGAEADALGRAVGTVGATAMYVGSLGAGGDIEGTMLHATPFLRMMGNVQLGLEAMHQAVAAKRLIDEVGETPYLAGKLLNLKYYTTNVLPESIAIGKSIQANDQSCLDERLFQVE